MPDNVKYHEWVAISDIMSMLAEVKAPANIKIGGEHSVVYGGPSLSAAISLYATSTVEDLDSKALEILLPDLDRRKSFSHEELEALHVDFDARDKSPPIPGREGEAGIKKYVAKHAGIGMEFLPYATIAARLHFDYGARVLSRRVTVRSDVPRQSGYASSAVCSTSFAMALVKAAGIIIGDHDAIDLIRDGERVQHGAEGSGRIDVGPAYFGGYVEFGKEGIVPMNIKTETWFVIFDTGPKPPTSEMVGRVRELYNRDRKHTDRILKEIDECVTSDVDALGKGDLKELGRLMSRNHELLRELGVSSNGLDTAVSIALSNGALGAKMCGGGGGGIGIALVNDDVVADALEKVLRAAGFAAYRVELSGKGAKDLSRIKS